MWEWQPLCDWRQKQMSQKQCKEWQERAAAPSPEGQKLSGPTPCLWTPEVPAELTPVTLSSVPVNPPTLSSWQKTWLFFTLGIYPLFLISEKTAINSYFKFKLTVQSRKRGRRMPSSGNEPGMPLGLMQVLWQRSGHGSQVWNSPFPGEQGQCPRPGTVAWAGFCHQVLSPQPLPSSGNDHLCQAHSQRWSCSISTHTHTEKWRDLLQEHEQTFFWAPSFFFFSSCFFFFFSSIKCSSSCVSCSFSLTKTKVRKSFSVKWSNSRKVNNPYLHC